MAFVKVPPRASGLTKVGPREVRLSAHRMTGGRGVGSYVARLSVGAETAARLGMRTGACAEVQWGTEGDLGTMVVRVFPEGQEPRDARWVSVSARGLARLSLTPLPAGAREARRQHARLEHQVVVEEVDIPLLVVTLPEDFYEEDESDGEEG